LTLDELRQQALSVDQSPSEPRESLTTAYARSKAIRDYVLMRAGGMCEACDREAPFLTDSERPYLETHHIRRLSDGGPDHPSRVAGVCPNCHRRAHYGNDREEFNYRLQEAVLEKETRC
jgi:5-methylcytosine-specific restriction enzyme A